MAGIESLIGKVIRFEPEPYMESVRRFRASYDTAHREWDQTRLELRSSGDGELPAELEKRIADADANYRRVRELEVEGILPVRVEIVLFNRIRKSTEVQQKQYRS